MNELQNTISKLIEFVDNGCRINKGVEPKFGEPFYGQYRMLVTKRDFSIGDRVSVIYSQNKYHLYGSYDRMDEWLGCENIEGTVLAIDKYDMAILIKGRKVWANERNVRRLCYTHIVSISLTKKVSEGFDLQSIAPTFVNKERITLKDIYGHNDKVRGQNKEQFLSLYPEVDFDNSHIVIANCCLYWPFKRNRIKLSVYITEDDGTVISRIPGKIGCIGNTFFAGNYYDKKHKDLKLFSYLPDASKQYENINVVCVWTVTTDTDDGCLDIVLVDIHHFDKIEPVVDNKNILFLDMRARTYIGYGKDIFERAYCYNLESLMDNDCYFIEDIEEDEAYSIKYTSSADVSKYSYLSMQAISDFNLIRLLSGICTGYDICRNFEVSVKLESSATQYDSTMWRTGEEQFEFFEFKLFDQDNTTESVNRHSVLD